MQIGNIGEERELEDHARLRSVAISPDEKYIAVGSFDGTVRIILAEEWKVYKTLKKERNMQISVIKFSPKGNYLAFGSDDSYISVYKVSDFKPKYKMKKHPQHITGIDWSRDDYFLQSTCGGQELLYWKMESGEQHTTGAMKLRDEKWSSWTCPIGWPVQGIWKSGMTGNEVNSVERSHSKAREEYSLLATGEKHKDVRVYRFPCLSKQSEAVVGKGHSTEVTRVAWNTKDEYLYTTGGKDQTVIVWKVQQDR